MLQSKKQNQNTFLQKLIRHRWLVVGLTLVIWILAIFSASSLNLDEDILKLLPDDDPQISSYRELMHQFNPMNSIIISVGADSAIGSSEEELINAADSFFVRLDESQYFSDLIYRWDFRDLQNGLEILNNYRSVLFTVEDSTELQKKLQYNYILDQMDFWKKTLAETPSPFLARQMINDPLDINEFLRDKLNSAQSGQGKITVYNGRLFTKKLDHILIVGKPKFESTDTPNAQKLVDFMENSIRKIESDFDSRIQISYLAAHRFNVENASRIKNDIQITVTLALVAIIILSLLVYSRPVLMILTLLPALFGTSVSLGLIRWVMPEISAIIIGSGAMLIGITVDYGIHFLYHADQIRNQTLGGNSIYGLLQRLFKPLLLGAGTTLIAFLALQFSGLPGYRQLSLFVSIGIFSALVFVVIVLPVLLSWYNPKNGRKPVIQLGNFFDPFFQWVGRFRKLVFTIVFVMIIALIPGFLMLEFEGDVQKLNAISPSIQNDIDNITRAFGDILSSTLVMVEADNMQDALEENEKVLDEIDQLKKTGYISSSSEIKNLLPSFKKQVENRSRWQHMFNQNTVNQLSKNLKSAANASGIREGVFENYVNRLGETSKLLEYKDFQESIFETILENFIKVDASKTYVLNNLSLTSADGFKKIRAQLEVSTPNITVYNGKLFVTQVVDLIFSELKYIGTIAFILILIFLILAKRNIKAVSLFILPLIISLVWTFGIMGWLGIKINIINSIVSVFIFGLVVDYCIFLNESIDNYATNNQDDFLSRTGGAITISSFTTMIGLGALVFAKHPTLHSLGLTALLGIAFGLMAVFFIIPALSLNVYTQEKK